MSEEVLLSPIGVIRTPFTKRADAPRQPRVGESVRGKLQLHPGKGFEDALSDLDSWKYAWVLFLFDQNADARWHPKVQPPRSDVKRGLFSTRSPYRPNPIGLSAVRIERVEALTVHVSELDILDGSPLLDIKPYLAWADAIPGAGSGWLADESAVDLWGRPPDPRTRWEVFFAPEAEAQLDFLAERGVRLRGRLLETLALGPQPHAYRRIRRQAEGQYRLAIEAWRARFRTLSRGSIEVLGLGTGYRARELHGDRLDDPALDVHRAFVDVYGLDSNR